MKLALTERTRAKSRRNRKVNRSIEFRRIESLPRRDWQTESSRLGEILAKPGGDMALWAIQEAALREAMQCGGLIGAIAVGKGKALVSILAGVVMDAKRPLLLVPASLKKQTLKDVLPEMRKHWHLHSNLRIVAYSELSQTKNADILNEIKPDLIIADEAHALKNLKSGRGRRVNRYMRDQPTTAFIALSGSISRKSIREYAHISAWCLGNKSPVPRTWREQNAWADALDLDVQEQNRIDPGALRRFDEENPRRGFGKRLRETRGFIISGEEELTTSLRLSARSPGITPPEITAAIKHLRATWETPDGDELTEAVQVWRKARELAAGFYYKPDPAPPIAWLRARKAWRGYVTHTLNHNKRGLDTEKQVWNDAVRQDRPPDAFLMWRELKARHKIGKTPVWLNTYILHDAAEWLDEHGGIVWVEQIAVGTALAKLSGYRYYGAGADDITEAKGPLIASIAAHGTGKNLQYNHSRNLVLTPPSSGATWEQLIGRTHRKGQPADVVKFETYQHTTEMRNAMDGAFIDAIALEDNFGRQKLTFCDLGLGIVRPT